jgi:uncharacterized protein (DUF427 family)
MGLTMGKGPLGPERAGRFNFSFEPPEPLLYLDPYPARVRAILAGETVVDSRRALLLHESGHLPVFWFPREDVRAELLRPSGRAEPSPGKGELTFHDLEAGGRRVPDAAREASDPFLAGLLTLAWDALDEWFVEDEQLFGHPKDPYSRIDVLKTTRHVRVLLDGEPLADTRRALMLLEATLPPRFYIPPDDVRTDLLVPSSNRSRCAYKGSAAYWHVRVGERVEEDLVWSYPVPAPEVEPIRDLLCFFNERVDLELDGVRDERPRTQWSRDADSPPGAQALRGLMGRRR